MTVEYKCFYFVISRSDPVVKRYVVPRQILFVSGFQCGCENPRWKHSVPETVAGKSEVGG